MPEGAFVGMTGSGIEVTGLTGGLSGAGYDLKAKTAYILYANGQREKFQITGAGMGGGQIALYLVGGGKVTINTKTGQVTTEMMGGDK